MKIVSFVAKEFRDEEEQLKAWGEVPEWAPMPWTCSVCNSAQVQSMLSLGVAS